MGDVGGKAAICVHLNVDASIDQLGKPMIMSRSCALPSWARCRLMPSEGANLPLIRTNRNSVENSIRWKENLTLICEYLSSDI